MKKIASLNRVIGILAKHRKQIALSCLLLNLMAFASVLIYGFGILFYLSFPLTFICVILLQKHGSKSYKYLSNYYGLGENSVTGIMGAHNSNNIHNTSYRITRGILK